MEKETKRSTRNEELESWKALADTRMEFLEWLCEKHNLDLSSETQEFENLNQENNSKRAQILKPESLTGWKQDVYGIWYRV